MKSCGKGLFVVLLVTLGVSVQASEAPEGFAGVKWGASSADVKTAFPEAKCKTLRAEKGHTAERCEVKNFKIGERPTEVTFYFADGVFYKINVTFASYGYDEMRDLLLAKYGEDVKVSTSPDKFARPTDEVTTTKWQWDSAEVRLIDQRKHSSFDQWSRFELEHINDAEKAKRQKALSSF